MENFISIVLFTLPGLLTYFWIQMFGLTPAVKYNSTEIVGISAMLWIPTGLFAILIYDVVYFLSDNFFRLLNLDLSFLNLHMILLIDDILIMSSNVLFLIFFFILSVLSSLIIALIWSSSLYKWVLRKINTVRLKRKVSELDEMSSIWDTFFIQINNDSENNKEEQQENLEIEINNEVSNESNCDNGVPLVVEIYNLNYPRNRISGCIINMSRPFEAERALILDKTEDWTKEHKVKNFPVKRTYVDTKSGLVVNELDYNSK